MANENMDRQMEFLLQQQAQSAARIQQIEEIILDLARGTRDSLAAHDKRFDEIDEKIAALVDSQIHTEEDLKKIKENVKETAEALRNLIANVDRYFERRNGNPQS